jgi:hypothetical protein
MAACKRQGALARIVVMPLEFLAQVIVVTSLVLAESASIFLEAPRRHPRALSTT